MRLNSYVEFRRNTDTRPAVHPHRSLALGPAVGLLAGIYVESHLTYLPILGVMAVIGLGMALGRQVGWGLAALGLGLLNATLQPQGEPAVPPQRPVELVAVVAGHPVRHDDSTYLFCRVRRWQVGQKVTSADFGLQLTMPPNILPPPIGSTLRIRGYLKRSPGYANDPPTPRGPWRLRLKSEHFLTLERPATGVSAGAGWLRRRAERAWDTPEIDGHGAALARALLLGDRSRLPASWQPVLRRSGLAHILAVSGLHVGLLALILALIGALLPPGLRYLPALCGIAAYLLLIGPRPAVLRASLMGLMAFGALALRRPPQSLHALASCAAFLAWTDPAIVERLGFQLSVAATAGIIVLTPILAERWTALPPGWRRPLAATVAAQLATLPWTVPLTGGIHPLSPLLNLIAVPLLATFLLVAFVWLALAMVRTQLAVAFLPVLDVLVWPIEFLVQMPPSSTAFLPVTVGDLWLPTLAVAFCWRSIWGVRGGLIAALLLLTGADSPKQNSVQRPSTEVVMLDVGQGDAILLRDGEQSLLVDGGGWPHGDFGGRVLVPALAAMGIRRLDAIVLTHPDRDHCGGLVDLGRYLPIGEVWSSPGWTDSPCAIELLTSSVDRWRVIWRGEVGRLGRWHIETLHPTAGSRLGRNNRSLVLLASFGEHRLLLTGDIEEQTERELLASRPEALTANLLKVAHHGSRSSSQEAFLRAVAPQLALVSSGVSNPYGHPHPRILERLSDAGAKVLRTDLSGQVRLQLQIDGGTSIALPGTPRSRLSDRD